MLRLLVLGRDQTTPSRILLATIWLSAALLVLCLAATAAGAAPGPGEKLDYSRDIRPILSNTCFTCHGPDEAKREAKLRLDIREGAAAMTSSGKVAVVPGKSAASELIARITHADPEERMPPASSGKPALTPVQIELLKRWIDEGAEFKGHWSFNKPVRPAVPEIMKKDLVRNAIDAFIIQRLERNGLAASPEADKVTLIRRVTIDLTGLPPTLAEVDAFLADKAPNAYEQLVDRLLKSPRFGEHMARYWLDAARYGDTHGLHLDNERSMWPYRDWVIDAFNQNKKFDEFTIEQLAGDLLPTPSLQQKVATGFNRCNVSTSEGGSIDEEVRVRYAVDRVETTSTVWLGLTLGCAVCHDHKFDPVSQKEFYQLFAYYGVVQDAAMDGNQLLPPPSVRIMTSEVTQKLDAAKQQLAAAQAKVKEELAKFVYEDPNPTGQGVSAQPQEIVWVDDDLPPGAQAQGNTPWEFVAAPSPIHSGAKSHTRTATDLSQHFFTAATTPLLVGEGDKLFTYVYLDPKNPPKEVMLQWNDGAWEHRAYWGENTIPWGADNSVSRFAAGPLPKLGEWSRLEIEASKVGLAPGAAINGWAFTQFGGTVHWDKSGIITRTPQNGAKFDSLAGWSVIAKANEKLAVPAPVRAALKIEADKRNDAQKKEIRDYFVEFVYGKGKETFDPLHKQAADLDKQVKDIEGAAPSTLVMLDKDTERIAHILKRGEYDKRGDKVTANVPASIMPMPADYPANRMGLAKWLVHPDHPLTARVNINRFWQQLFGTGIVKTSEDFGAQGEWPSHPDLLDWLSVEFRESGWDMKHMIKLMVMSGSYRQTSKITPDRLEKDRDNRLLSRGPRFRLDAEAVRDTTLFTSGMLIEKIGGKSVKPYQPEGIWEAVAFIGSNTRDFKQDAGEALYRRSMYTFWKRTSPPPSLLTFDAPSRETCTVRRARTNTPLQALVLMNDKQYVEAARGLAARMMSQGGTTPAERLGFAFRLATSRVASADELAILQKIYTEELARFTADPEAAKKLLAVGDTPPPATMQPAELAAYAMTANAILNLDETITKE